MSRKRMITYIIAAALIILSAGCGWQSGESFLGEFNPDDKTPVTAVQKWFKSLEWLRSENEEGVMAPNPENGRDFELYLEVVNPEDLVKQLGNATLTKADLEQLNQDVWQSNSWEVEFLDVQLEELQNDGVNATVKITGGKIRYIGEEMFGTKEYKEDNYGDKEGEIYLQWIDYSGTPEKDPLVIWNSDTSKSVPRWVVVGGLDLSEDKPFGETPSS
ncbi:MAG: hypothetical protein SWK76_06245 [Actinomycetota bacterium]|nr:hypothetical protein [Actinomycetota bacterium]